MQSAEEVIVAPATGAGRSAIAVVRASGPAALHMASTLAGGRAWRPRHATLTTLTLADGLVEQAVVTAFPGPRSFTGENLVEFSTHGSPVIVNALVRACLEQGARMARPGEFTLRAYLHGRLDLVQAEAVNDLIAAVTAAQVGLASSHLHGVLSATIARIGDDIAALRALLEASLDFPDEGFHFVTPENALRRVRELEAECHVLLSTADAGRRLHDGALVVIAGPPNAGKSSLFNALLGRLRAIVTEIRGTTRDLLSDTADVGGVPVTLIDTAGLHDSVHVVELEGMARSRDAMAAADVVIVAVDPGAPADDLVATEALWATLDQRRLCVVTKQDRGRQDRHTMPTWLPADAVTTSAVAPGGVEALRLALAARLGQTSWEGATLTHARHRAQVEQCATCLGRAVVLLEGGGSEEFVLADLHEALRALEGLRGVETPDEVLHSIFSTFCIGK